LDWTVLVQKPHQFRTGTFFQRLVLIPRSFVHTSLDKCDLRGLMASTNYITHERYLLLLFLVKARNGSECTTLRGRSTKAQEQEISGFYFKTILAPLASKKRISRVPRWLF